MPMNQISSLVSPETRKNIGQIIFSMRKNRGGNQCIYPQKNADGNKSFHLLNVSYEASTELGVFYMSLVFTETMPGGFTSIFQVNKGRFKLIINLKQQNQNLKERLIFSDPKIVYLNLSFITKSFKYKVIWKKKIDVKNILSPIFVTEHIVPTIMVILSSYLI